MAIVFAHDAEGTTDEADVPTGSNPNDFSAGTVKNGALTIKYDDGQFMHGSRAIRFTRGVAADSGYLLKQLGAAVSRLQLRTYVRIPALPTSQLNLFVFREAASFMGYVSLNAPGVTAGRLALLNKTAGTINSSVSGDDFPINQWVRIEAAIQKGTTTANGVIEFAYYLGDSSSPEHQWTSVGSGLTINTGVVDPQGVRFGINGTTAVPTDVWMDDFALGDGVSGLIGPASTAAPVVVLNGAIYYVIDARGSTVPSSPAAYSISPSGGVIEIVEGVFLVPMTSAVQTKTITVQGATGSPATMDHDVPSNTVNNSPVRLYLMEGGVLV